MPNLVCTVLVIGIVIVAIVAIVSIAIAIAAAAASSAGVVVVVVVVVVVECSLGVQYGLLRIPTLAGHCALVCSEGGWAKRPNHTNSFRVR